MHKYREKERGRVKFCEIVLLFTAASVLGTVLEGVWSVFEVGYWIYHTSLVFGPFNTIYGFGAVALYLISERSSRLRLPTAFLLFAALGGAVEYFGGVLQAAVFGTRSWDYSGQLMNIGGYVCLLSVLVWGALGVIFTRLICPLLRRLFAKVNIDGVKPLAIFLCAFFILNGTITSVAIHRWQSGRIPKSEEGGFFAAIDERFDNRTMRELFPTMRKIK